MCVFIVFILSSFNSLTLLAGSSDL